MNNIKLLVGLGNHGNEYCYTRHNVGFWFIDRYIEVNNVIKTNNSMFDAIVNTHMYKNYKIFLIKPQKYMNLSGEVVLAIKNFYKIDIENIIVIHDEISFNPGIIKFKQGGGDNGHNGLKNISKLIGNNYLRLRCGIGEPNDRSKLINHVLSKPNDSEYNLIITSIDKSLQVIKDVFDGQLNNAMKQLHT